MSLSLTVLGGAAAWPNPGQGCSSYLVARDSQSLVLDCGPDTLLELRKHIDYREIDAIFVSHCHADHILDLVPYRYGLVYGPLPPERSIPIWLPPGGEQTLNGLAQVFGALSERADDFWSSAFDVDCYDPTDVTVVDDLRVTFRSTSHFAPCYAMRVTDEFGRSIVYGADTGTIEPLIDFAAGADILIAEATLDEDDTTPPDKRGHLTPSLAGQLASKCGVETLVLTHLWAERPTEDVVRDASAAFSGRIEVARPGLRIDV